jgi:hypothetical protein
VRSDSERDGERGHDGEVRLRGVQSDAKPRFADADGKRPSEQKLGQDQVRASDERHTEVFGAEDRGAAGTAFAYRRVAQRDS